MVKFYIVALLTFVDLTQTNCQETSVLDELFLPIARHFQISIGKVFRDIEPSNRRLLKRMGKAVPVVSPTKQFHCDIKDYKPRSESIPDSVHKLRPGDIDVIGAMGDSLTAGTGISATSVPEEVLVSQRGRSWSGGGEKNWRHFLTLPNILKEFNPNLIGFATRSAYSTEWASQFNVAEPGAISAQMPFMATELIKRIKTDPRIDVKNHWKMITLMIGDNDFCSEVCLSNSYYKAIQKHKEDLYKVLRYLKDNLARTIVNVVPPPIANGLWNSIMEPFGHKNPDGTDNASKFHCPSEKHPYIYTLENS
ncbi:phospholipase B1, membrane-associated-like isoform X3 [Diabrotica virgifera virgifera]|uniref:Phospholipase B1, membrane-associated-like isoform X2 n=1 Tax=Diabrotica virgifera virgifera TaxID=50390 RepID=A0A6P7FDD1_DIAVI|nr:phospholipase B1, membrane-associated-like isoform X3 [Diabrotica virgifera virgifera]